MNGRRGARAQSKQGASERANGRASGPILTSQFMALLNHSGPDCAPFTDFRGERYKIPSSLLGKVIRYPKTRFLRAEEEFIDAIWWGQHKKTHEAEKSLN